MSDNGVAGDIVPRSGTELCSPFIEGLPVTGASISVIGRLGHQSTIGATDSIAERIEELQFELGEGPHWKALRTGKAVQVSKLQDGRHPEWPIFGAAALELGIGALFVFPLVMGAVTIGVVDLYRWAPGALSTSAMESARALAGSIAGPALRQAARSAGEDPTANTAQSPEMRREVHQATGMILVQLDTDATAAFFHLRAHAFSSGRTVQDVAHDVVMRRLDFGDRTE